MSGKRAVPDHPGIDVAIIPLIQWYDHVSYTHLDVYKRQAQGPHFIKRGGHQVQIAGNNDFNGCSLPFPLGDTVVHFPDKQKIGFYQVRPGHAGHAERAEAQQENAEKPEYFDGKGHEKDTACLLYTSEILPVGEGGAGAVPFGTRPDGSFFHARGGTAF